MTELGPPPVIVLVEPQLGENIGACARAMLNCCLDELRLVRPRDTWPNPRARAAATGATAVIERAQVFDSVRAAVADLVPLLATTARPRDMAKRVIDPQTAARQLREAQIRGQQGGLLFGPERTGLSNDQVALASSVVHIPLNPDFSSLNLAQAVLLMAWEWWQSAGPASAEQPVRADEQPATRGALVHLFEHLEQELAAAEFFRVPENQEGMIRGLRNILHRAELSAQEVRTLHGVVAALSGRRKDGGRVRQPRRGRERESGEEKK